MSKNEILLQLLPPEIEMPMTKSQLLGGELLSSSSRHGNCGRLCRPDQFDFMRPHFDVASVELGISHFCRTQSHLATHPYHALLAEGRGLFDLSRGSPFGIERDLNDSGAVAEIEENNATKIS